MPFDGINDNHCYGDDNDYDCIDNDCNYLSTMMMMMMMSIMMMINDDGVDN